jgi:hypothetical protein
MKVKIIEGMYWTSKGKFHVGDVVDVTKEDAEMLLKNGNAVSVQTDVFGKEKPNKSGADKKKAGDEP